MSNSASKKLRFRLVSTEKAPVFLLLQADPSKGAIQKYLPFSACYVAELQGKIIGVFVLKQKENLIFELMNIAVKSEFQRKGFGKKLLKEVIDTASRKGAKILEVGTGTFGYQLAYYQKMGFRVTSIEKDFFLDNYPESIFEQGIQHKDMLRLTLEF